MPELAERYAAFKAAKKAPASAGGNPTDRYARFKAIRQAAEGTKPITKRDTERLPDWAERYAAFKAAKKEPAGPPAGPGVMDRYARFKAIRQAAEGTKPIQAPPDRPLVIETALEALTPSSLRQLPGMAVKTLYGAARGAVAGVPETAGFLKKAISPAAEASVLPSEELGAAIAGEGPPGPAGRPYRAGRQLGRTLAGFAAAPLTIPWTVGATAAKAISVGAHHLIPPSHPMHHLVKAMRPDVYPPGHPLRPSVLSPQPELWDVLKHESWGLLSGVVPPVGAVASYREIWNDPSKSDAEKEQAWEDFLAEEGPALLGATVGIAAGMGRRMYQNKLRARAFADRTIETTGQLKPHLEAARTAARRPARAAEVPRSTDFPRVLDEALAQEPQAPPRPVTATPAADSLARGREVAIKTPAGNYDARYEVVSADDIVASHKGVGFERDTRYPVGIQERPYHRDKVEQAKVAANAGRYDPRFVVADIPTATDGPPVLASDSNVVLGGNSRMMTHQRIVSGQARTNALRDYYTELVGKAEQFGLDRSAVERLVEEGRNPVLVRRLSGVRSGDLASASEAARRFNLDFKQAVEPIAAAVSRAKNLPQAAFDEISAALEQAGPEATLKEAVTSGPVQQRLVRQLVVSGIVPSTEINRYVEPTTGRINDAGFDMIEKMLAASVVPDADLISVAPKSAVSKIVRSTQPLILLKSRGAAWDLSGDLTEAVRLNTRAGQAQLGVADYLGQKSLFGEEPRSPRAEVLALALESMRPRQFLESVRQYAADAGRDVEGQGMLAGFAAPRTPSQSFALHFGSPAASMPAAVAAYRPASDIQPPPVAQPTWGREGAPAETISTMWSRGGDLMRDGSASLYGLDEKAKTISDPARSALWDEWIEGHLEDHEPPTNRRPRLVLMGGGWGSGKSHTRRVLGRTEGYVEADADAFKLAAPERTSAQLPSEVLEPWLHEESSALSKKLADSALDRGVDIVYDSSGKGKAIDELIGKAKSLGYEIEAIYVSTDPEAAFGLTEQRALKSGRRRNTRRELFQNHKDAARSFFRRVGDGRIDRLVAVSNPPGGDPVLAYEREGVNGRVHLPEVLQREMQKATMDVEAISAAHQQAYPVAQAAQPVGAPPEGIPQRFPRGAPDSGAARVRPTLVPAPPPVQAVPGTQTTRPAELAPPARRQAAALAYRPASQTNPQLPGYRPPATPAQQAAVIGRNAILERLSKRLKIPVWFGKSRRIPKDARAGFVLKPEIVLSRMRQDISAVAHEVGHYIEKRVFGSPLAAVKPSKLPPELAAEWIDLASSQKMPTLSEGLAESVRLFVEDPESLAKRPNAHRFIAESVFKELPEALEALMEARGDYARWRAAPAVAKFASEIDFDPSKPTPFSWDRFYTHNFDDLHPIRQAVEALVGKDPSGQAAYEAFRTYRGWKGIADSWHEKARTEFSDPLKPTGKSLREILHPVWPAYKDFAAYATARRVAERLDKGFTMPWTKDEASAVIRQLESKPFKTAFDELQQYQMDLVRYLKDSGGLSADQVSSIAAMSADYVPLYRVMTESAPQRYDVGRKFVNLFEPIRRMRGSRRKVIDPLESIYKNTLALISWAERNAATRDFFNFVTSQEGWGRTVEMRRLDPHVRPTTVDVGEVLKAAGLEGQVGVEDGKTVTIFRADKWQRGKDEVSYWDKGKLVRYEVPEMLRSALEALDREPVQSWMKILRFPASWLRAGATLVPGFILRNPLRDQLTAFAYSRYGFVPGVDLARGVWHALAKDDDYWNFRRSGAAYAELVSLDRNYLRANLQQLMEGKAKRSVRLLTNPINFLRAASRLSEEATRIMEVKKAIASERARGVAGRELARTAGYAGREVTLDFNRIGAKQVSLNQIAAFWNAGLQGWDKMVRSFKDRPLSTSARVALGVTLPSVLLYLVNKDEPWYQDLEQWERDLFWHVKAGDTIYRYPKPFEVGLLYGSYPERLMAARLRQDPHVWDGALEQLWRMIPNPTPTGALPLIENITGYSFFYGGALVPRSQQELPAQYQYGPYTSETAKQLGSLPTRFGAVEGISPYKIENVMRGYFGGLGPGAMELAERGLGVSAGGERPAKTTQETVLPGLVTRHPGLRSAPIEEFYQDYKKARQAESTIRELPKRGELAEYEGVRPRYAPTARMTPLYRKYAEAIAQLTRQMQKIASDPAMSADDKRHQIDALAARRTALARQANTAIHSASGGQR